MRWSDEDVLHIVEYGRYPQRPDYRPSYMPAFRGLLDDRDILPVPAHGKARWPIGQRALQALRNLQLEGMSAEAETTDWGLAATRFA